MSAASEIASALNPFEKRASRTISQAGLFTLVQDLAKEVDVIGHKVDEVDRKLDLVLEILHGRTQIGA